MVYLRGCETRFGRRSSTDLGTCWASPAWSASF